MNMDKFFFKYKEIVSLILACSMMVGSLTASLFITFPEDNYDSYVARIDERHVYENTIETAYPQTVVANLVRQHFASPLPAGKTEKKAIIIGYDGCRADAIDLTYDTGASHRLLKEGGHAYLAYCGGVPYPAVNTQDTSTAPGWCSILTGVWANVHGITSNGIPKDNNAALTILTTLVENGTIDSSAFYTMWAGHFTDENSTYINEKKYCEQKGLDVTFSKSLFDIPTTVRTITDIRAKDCSDLIFTIIEATDGMGHSSGFSPNNPLYTFGAKCLESLGGFMIDAIEARDTYDTEDWLIVITSDHGGIEKSHGGSSIQERMTFIITNKALS